LVKYAQKAFTNSELSSTIENGDYCSRDPIQQEVLMIVGKDLRLRAVDRTDLKRFVEWLNDREVTRNLLLYRPLSMGQEEQWYEGVLKRAPDESPLVIEVLEGDQWRMIGNCGLMDIDWRNRTAEIGIFIGEKDCWNKGYGRQAMALMVQHGFNNVNLNRIYLYVYETNLRGIRAYEHVGFVHEGRLRQAIVQDGQYIDVLLMSVLRSEWKFPEF
jgi:RimJ/RimL family protein N-acetyltransferase